MDISIVIPLYNEAESLSELHEWISRVMLENGFSHEVIFVDDGSTDGSWKIIKNLSMNNKNVKGIKFRRNHGKSAALNSGFEISEGNVVITMDADMQDSPDEIPALFRMIKDEDYDLVSGWKKERHDPVMKIIPSKFFNWITKKVSGILLHDFNCGLKAYKKGLVKSIEVYGEMHRYIPVIAKWNGFTKIGEKIVEHRERKYGVTKFGLERFINGFLDLLSISFVARFGKRPMHLFGLLGMLMFVIGFWVSAWLGVEKLYALHNGLMAPLVTDNPLFYIALTTMILGTQLFLAGFIAEMISRSSSNRNQYLKEEIINR